MRISEAATKSGLSIDTIRYYERMITSARGAWSGRQAPLFAGEC